MSAPATVATADLSIAYAGGLDVVDRVSFDVPAGQVAVLLGPSGCGKTTLLRAIAGLQRPRHGSVSIGGEVVADPSRFVPPELRGVGMVFQDAALFPHLSVADNVAFGLRKLAPAQRRARVGDLLDLVGLGPLADRSPATLSGGQQQRVALARSLAPNPSVLLLDEPFSALDASLRGQIRREVTAILADVGITTIFVTHDQDEAFALGDLVGVMRDGRLEQFGPPEEIYLRPQTPWVAEFVGEANLLSADATGRRATTVLGAIALTEPHHGAVTVLVRPEAITMRPGGTARIVAVEYFGHDARYELAVGDQTIVCREQGESRWRAGDSVAPEVNASEIVAWPAARDPAADAAGERG